MTSGKKYVLGAVLILGLSAFAEQTAEKKYKLEYTIAEWDKKLQTLGKASNAIRNSDIPIKEASPILDSIASFQAEIFNQIKPQMAADSTHK